jgi:hypothetical protein
VVDSAESRWLGGTLTRQHDVHAATPPFTDTAEPWTRAAGGRTMVAVPQLVEHEDPFTAAERTADDTMTPLRAVHDELRVIAERRLGEQADAMGALIDRR